MASFVEVVVLAAELDRDRAAARQLRTYNVQSIQVVRKLIPAGDARLANRCRMVAVVAGKEYDLLIECSYNALLELISAPVEIARATLTPEAACEVL